MHVARTLPELAQRLAALRAQRGRIALVATMGALHAGHVALLDRARSEPGALVASIYVNPLQFNQPDDFARYPRDEAADLAVLRGAGCDLAWLPEPGAMRAPGASAVVTVGGPAERWEADHRPGHFRGMATVVATLFGQIRPDASMFGEKDWQQLQVVTRMTADLHLGVRIVGVPTVREPDGLALSSRNRFLSPSDRDVAPVLAETLRVAAATLTAGDDAAAPLRSARDRLMAAGLVPDYVALVEPASLLPVARADRPARLIAAARLGGVRLLDNLAVG